MSRFSDHFKVTRGPDDDWFDPHLTIDTPLFIDPLLMILEGGKWAAAHDRLLDHFTYCYRLVAKSTSTDSPSAVTARRLLTFPEPAELGLGYTRRGTRGAGSGAGYARRIADGIAVAISRGLDQPEHIEEIGILNQGIGADRISDAVANVLKSDLIDYTKQVCERHQVPTEEHQVVNARVFPEHGRWLRESVRLPTNPATGKPTILVPARLLNDLPVLNADDWFDSTLNEDIRAQLNLGVGRRVTKRDIVAFARQFPDRVRAWARSQTSRPDLASYDLDADPQGVVQWDRAPIAFALENPLPVTSKPTNLDGLQDLVRQVLESFRHFVEDQRGWSMLWNSDGSEKPEEAAQLMFMGMAQHYLRLFNVEIDREVELGRGPVDFKISSGVTLRVLIEVKKAHNGKFWNGLDSQLISYLDSDDCQTGWYLAIRYRNNPASEVRMRTLAERVRKASARTGKDLSYKAVDARPRGSASKL